MWLLGMTGATTVEYKSNLLEIWITGIYSKMMEELSESDVLSHTVENIRRFLGKKFNITDPIAMIRTQWYNNPYFKGTYSYRSVETDKRNTNAEILGKSIYKKLPVIINARKSSNKNNCLGIIL